MIDLAKACRMSVLDETGATPVSCVPKSRAGSRMIFAVGEVLPATAAVRIDNGETLLLGEVQGCWRDGETIFAAVGLKQELAGFREVTHDAGWPVSWRPPVKNALAGGPEKAPARRYGWMIP